MIFIGLGANLPSTEYGSPKNTLEAALAMLTNEGVPVVRRSRWYTSPPVPPSDQAWYVNGVARVETDLSAVALLSKLHGIEQRIGRTRRTRWEARIVDLDLLAYDDQVTDGGDKGLCVPHPRLHQRQFVLQPLAEISGNWQHPTLGLTVPEMLADLAPDPRVQPIGAESAHGAP